MADEKTIRMAAELYSMRNTARQLLGASYFAKMAELGAVLQKVAAQTNREPLAVALEASKGADATSVCFFLAACVEMTEPTATAQQAPTGGAAP